MSWSPRHKVFISFHHEDQAYKDLFVRMMESGIVDRSIDDGDIGDGLAVDTIRRKIRDEFIADATVTVVLVGSCTWQRKHVDWEIGSSLRKTRRNSRCGLLGILLPTHPDCNRDRYNSNLIPPRLADNCGEGSYAAIYDWTSRVSSIRMWIDQAFERRKSILPDNSRPQFGRNRSGYCSEGWRD